MIRSTGRSYVDKWVVCEQRPRRRSRYNVSISSSYSSAAMGGDKNIQAGLGDLLDTGVKLGKRSFSLNGFPSSSISSTLP